MFDICSAAFWLEAAKRLRCSANGALPSIYDETPHLYSFDLATTDKWISHSEKCSNPKVGKISVNLNRCPFQVRLFKGEDATQRIMSLRIPIEL